MLSKVTGGNRNTDVNTFQSRESMAQLPVDPEQVKRDAVLMANVSGLSDSSADPTYDGEEKSLQLYCPSLQSQLWRRDKSTHR